MREASFNRASKETNITIKLNIDGTGETKISSGIGFLDHMLELFAFWGHFDFDILTNKADLNVDIHHTNEDLGIVLGAAFKKALGDKAGIRRIGSASAPMENVTAYVTVDISGRGSFALLVKPEAETITSRFAQNIIDEYKLEDAGHFFEAFAKQLGMNLNIKLDNPSADLHASLEPIFKALGIALDQATQIDPRRKGIPSTKGVID
jgi:imidazoleglycerol-phosphate dehydratase